jgi:hypothetical protein
LSSVHDGAFSITPAGAQSNPCRLSEQFQHPLDYSQETRTGSWQLRRSQLALSGQGWTLALPER